MKAQDKPKYVDEARKLLESLSIEALVTDPNNLQEIKKVNRLIAIFINFSFNDGQELRRLFLEFQKWARSSSHKGTIRNRAIDVIQFIDQKIEEMDIYVIDEPVKNSQERIIKNLKDEKLWVRSSLEGKDLHILIGERGDKHGEHVHLISDSDTGEIRVHAEDKSPKELIERVAVITTKSGATLGLTQFGVKTTMEFFDKDGNAGDIPILYATGIRRSGGPNGHFDYFIIKNIGKEIALDIHWGIRAFAYEWRPSDEPFELGPNIEKEVIYPISNEKIFTLPVPELNVIMEYKDAKGKAYFSRRELIQVKVPSGAFFELKADTFFPPSVLVDDGLRLVSEPTSNGDRVEAVFSISTKEGEKKIVIGVSRTFLAIWGFDTQDLIKQALLELGHRKIRRMIKEGGLSDYIFTTIDFPTDYPSGFEGYKKVRDSI